MYWPHGTYGTSSYDTTWICSAICLRRAGSVARSQSARSFSSSAASATATASASRIRLRRVSSSFVAPAASASS